MQLTIQIEYVPNLFPSSDCKYLNIGNIVSIPDRHKEAICKSHHKLQQDTHLESQEIRIPDTKFGFNLFHMVVQYIPCLLNVQMCTKAVDAPEWTRKKPHTCKTHQVLNKLLSKIMINSIKLFFREQGC